jgi:hypothetical protein
VAVIALALVAIAVPVVGKGIRSTQAGGEHRDEQHFQSHVNPPDGLSLSCVEMLIGGKTCAP